MSDTHGRVLRHPLRPERKRAGPVQWEQGTQTWRAQFQAFSEKRDRINISIVLFVVFELNSSWALTIKGKGYEPFTNMNVYTVSIAQLEIGAVSRLTFQSHISQSALVFSEPCAKAASSQTTHMKPGCCHPVFHMMAIPPAGALWALREGGGGSAQHSATMSSL